MENIRMNKSVNDENYLCDEGSLDEGLRQTCLCHYKHSQI